MVYLDDKPAFEPYAMHQNKVKIFSANASQQISIKTFESRVAMKKFLKNRWFDADFQQHVLPFIYKINTHQHKHAYNKGNSIETALQGLVYRIEKPLALKE